MILEEKLKQLQEKIKKYPLTCIVILATVLLFLLIVIPYLQIDFRGINNVTEKAKLENDYRATFAQIIGGFVVLLGLYFTWGNLEVSREGQITERFTRAVDQLGSKKLEIRLGGIYALERISNRSENDYWPIIEILTAYVRENSQSKNRHIKVEDVDIQNNVSLHTTYKSKVSLDIEAILTVIRRRIYFHKELNGLDIQRTHLQHANLQGANLQQANLEEADFYYANLEGANLEGANLKGANLEGANLEGANLKGANLRHANLRWANIRRTKLVKAALRGSNLENASCYEANLGKAEFMKANLSHVDLRETNLFMASFYMAKLEWADLRCADLRGANLQEANLQQAKLQGADFSPSHPLSTKGANLSGANLSGANLSGANLQGANLQQAKLQEADLSPSYPLGAQGSALFVAYSSPYPSGARGANLYGADICGADLQKANLKGAENLTIDQLSKVFSLYNAELDEDLRKELEEKYPDKYQALIKNPN